MPAIVIIGAQWGDEGKGKVVDILAAGSELVARFDRAILPSERYFVYRVPTQDH